MHTNADDAAFLAECAIHTPAPAPARPDGPQTFKHGAYDICTACQFPVAYCACAPLQIAEPPANDGAGSDLARRIAQARAAAGGR